MEARNFNLMNWFLCDMHFKAEIEKKRIVHKLSPRWQYSMCLHSVVDVDLTKLQPCFSGRHSSSVRVRQGSNVRCGRS